MTPEKIALVQKSFSQVVPIADQAAMLFYDRLFEIAPEVKPMFKGDIKEQGRKLMATLGIVVTGLTRLETVLPAASALAKKHVSYGVKDEHYPIVGSALLWTLEKGLGEAWTPEISNAWTTAYGTLSGYMISESHGAQVAEQGST
jgi:hemoglobin-like flavoprotein